MKQGLRAALIIVVLAAGMLTSCDGLGGEAEFEVSSLTITPGEVMIGEMVTVSVDVANVGSRQGIYEGVLNINGEEWEKKDITVPKEGEEELTFILTPGVPGKFEISVDDLSGLLTVNLRTERIELGYDDGRPDDLLGVSILGPGSGYLVQFSPPATPFTIEGVRIYGNLRGEISSVLRFQLEIWDKNQDIIYSTTYPYTMFSPTPSWAELAVDDVSVDDTFYIHVCTNSTENSGVQVFYDSSMVNTHSDVTKNWELSEDWYPVQPKEETNWMIRVDGAIFISTLQGEGGSE